MRHPSRLLALCCCLLPSAGLTACGSGHKVGSAQEVLSEAFGPGKPVKSGRLDLGLRFDSTGLSGIDGPIAASLTGPFQSKDGKTLPAFDFDLAIDAGGGTFSAGAVSTGKAGYVKLAGTTYRLSDKFFTTFEKGYKQAATTKGAKRAAAPPLAAIGVDPRRWLRAPRKVGTDEVGGAKSTHVTARVEVPKLLGDVDTLLRKADTLGATKTAGLPNGLSAKLRAQLAQAVKAATFDVWAGVDDGTLRRLLINIRFAVPPSLQPSAGGLKRGTLRIDLKLEDLNKPQTIAQPKNAHPQSELTAQVNALLGRASSAAPSAGSSGSGSASGSARSQYLQCLTDAGADIKKVQACADLLGK